MAFRSILEVLMSSDNHVNLPIGVFAGPFLRSGFNYDRDAASNEAGLKCEDPSLTQQQFAEEADINTIVDRFMRTGVMPEGVSVPSYADFEGIFDFQTAQNAVRKASENFFSMPAELRSRFQNSPQVFLEFFADPANTDEAIKLGLAVPRPGQQSGAAQPAQEGGVAPATSAV